MCIRDRLINVLNGPLWAFGGVLQARIRQLEEAGEGAAAEPAD